MVIKVASTLTTALDVSQGASQGVAGNSLLFVKGNGNVGIGTNAPDQKLTVNGNASKPGGGSWLTFSDERLKKNITDYNKGLKEILAIHPVSFQYNRLSGYADQSKMYVGILAQEIKKILPSSVSAINTDKQVKDKLQFDGSELTFTLINAVKEQQAQIEELKQANAKTLSLQKENDALRQNQQQIAKRMDQLEAMVLRQQQTATETLSRK